MPNFEVVGEMTIKCNEIGKELLELLVNKGFAVAQLGCRANDVTYQILARVR